MKNFVFAISVLFLLSACASAPGPMQTSFGLVKTDTFDPLFVASTKNRSTDVKYKSPTLMFRGEMPDIALFNDILVIADNGIFLVEWDTERFKFNHKLELSYPEIEGVKSVIKERSFLPSSYYLEVATIEGDQYNFAIFDGTVERAKQFIESSLDR